MFGRESKAAKRCYKSGKMETGQKPRCYDRRLFWHVSYKRVVGIVPSPPPLDNETDRSLVFDKCYQNLVSSIAQRSHVQIQTCAYVPLSFFFLFFFFTDTHDEAGNEVTMELHHSSLNTDLEGD